MVMDLLLDTIRSTCGYAREHEAEFVEKIRSSSEVKREDSAKALKRSISKSEKRIAELDHLLQKIYEDNVNGKISDKRFTTLMERYEKEQAELEESVLTAKDEIAAFEDDTDKTEQFISLVHKYTDITELTAAMIHEFVDKIIVHEADKSSGVRMQQIDIYLKYIGKVDPPKHELTPEEFAEEERKRRKRAFNRTYMRRRYEKEKAAREAAKNAVGQA